MPTLAHIDKAKLQEDESATSGENAFFYYYTEEQREEERVVIKDGHWFYQQSGQYVFEKKQKLMYAVLDTPSGGTNLYVFDTTVHSQLNAGNPVRSAGWVSISGNTITIDNSSGHYTPSLSLFIYTLKKIQRFLGASFIMELNEHTKLDIPNKKLLNEFTNLLASTERTRKVTINHNTITFKSALGSVIQCKFHELCSPSTITSEVPSPHPMSRECSTVEPVFPRDSLIPDIDATDFETRTTSINTQEDCSSLVCEIPKVKVDLEDPARAIPTISKEDRNPFLEKTVAVGKKVSSGTIKPTSEFGFFNRMNSEESIVEIDLPRENCNTCRQ